MGWKGTLRSLEAAQRRYERDARRRQRELERQRAQLEKMQELERAAYEVQVHENQIDVLLSLHKDCGRTWDWKRIHSSPPPAEPVKSHSREEAAAAELDAYKPGLADKFLKRTESKREELTQAVHRARNTDEAVYQEALRAYDRDYADWQATRELAERILDGDASAYIEAIEQTNPFSECKELGSSLEFEAAESSTIKVSIGVSDEKVIPKESKTLLKSGKLSVKPMTKTRFYELYQDHVCSCILRVARELFALLPIDTVFVTAKRPLLNTQTGHFEIQPIVSVAIPRTTFEALNFEMLDPSESMVNFVHRAAFGKTTGFRAIDPLQPTDLEAAS